MGTGRPFEGGESLVVWIAPKIHTANDSVHGTNDPVHRTNDPVHRTNDSLRKCLMLKDGRLALFCYLYKCYLGRGLQGEIQDRTPSASQPLPPARECVSVQRSGRGRPQGGRTWTLENRKFAPISPLYPLRREASPPAAPKGNNTAATPPGPLIGGRGLRPQHPPPQIEKRFAPPKGSAYGGDGRFRTGMLLAACCPARSRLATFTNGRQFGGLPSTRLPSGERLAPRRALLLPAMRLTPV